MSPTKPSFLRLYWGTVRCAASLITPPLRCNSNPRRWRRRISSSVVVAAGCVIPLSIVVSLSSTTTTTPDGDFAMFFKRRRSALIVIIVGVLIGVVVVTVCFLLLTAIMTVRYQRNRLEPHPEAVHVLQKGVEMSGRIRVVPGKYDLYLPPPPPEKKSRDDPSSGSASSARVRDYDRGLYFIPGALLSPAVYAQVMHALSEEGVLVMVQNTEPCRLPDKTFGLTADNVLSMTRDVEHRYHVTARQWSLGGHSLGGHAAAEIVQELRKAAPKVGPATKLVLWGLYSMVNLDLSECASVRALVVTATNDGFRPANDDDDDKWTSQLLSRLPPDTTCCDIQGGNHSGFGTYGPQRFYKQDGVRSISLEEQHRQVVHVTADFLKATSSASKQQSR